MLKQAAIEYNVESSRVSRPENRQGGGVET